MNFIKFVDLPPENLRYTLTLDGIAQAILKLPGDYRHQEGLNKLATFGKTRIIVTNPSGVPLIYDGGEWKKIKGRGQ